MPQSSRAGLGADDFRLAAVPSDEAAIGKLTAPSGLEGRLGERDLARQGVDDLGFDSEDLALFVAVEVHGSPLGLPRPAGAQPRRRCRQAAPSLTCVR